MRYHALACDYDGTLAEDGKVSKNTIGMLEKLLMTGRKLILLTGRELPDLQTIFPEIALFHAVVAENGAVLYIPGTRAEKVLAQGLPVQFAEELRRRGVEPVSCGRIIVSTRQPNEAAVLATIRDLGLELQVIFNKGAVMVVPAGVNKATGLAAAVGSLGLSTHGVVGIGDAENDGAFLDACEGSVAVANALESVKSNADWVTSRGFGDGVGELITELAADDLAARDAAWTRHDLLLGTRSQGGGDVRLSPRGPNVLVCGPSGSGKSTVASAFLERLNEQRYQFCIIDPEGDYEGIENATTLGRGGRAPIIEEVIEVLGSPQHNAVVNLIGLPVAERPPFFMELLPRLQDLRTRTGRPEWLVVDEAHHLIPTSWAPAEMTPLAQLERTMFVTVHPDQLLHSALASIGIVISVGKNPAETFANVCRRLDQAVPGLPAVAGDDDVVLLWRVSEKEAAAVRIARSHAQRQRHTRKYAAGELPPDRSFYFRGPENRLNLKATNLQDFLQLADGVDDGTWFYHLRRGDYSRWGRLCIKDESLADDIAVIEGQSDLSGSESRTRLREAIERRYTISCSRCVGEVWALLSEPK